jgi:hypothetical protein
MDDAARSWVSPFCMLSEPGTEVFQFSVWVLHPGPQYVGDATVTVRLYNCITGDLVGYDTKTLKPRTSDKFNPDLIEFGWLQIQSNKPVLPWGLTPWESGTAHGLMSLTWYRRESLSDLAKDFSKAVSSALRGQ